MSGSAKVDAYFMVILTIGLGVSLTNFYLTHINPKEEPEKGEVIHVKFSNTS